MSENEENKLVNKTRTPLTHRMWAKVIAFIMALLMLALAVGSILGAVIMIEEGVYTRSEQETKDYAFRNIAGSDVLALIDLATSGRDPDKLSAKEFLEKRNIASVTLTFSDGVTDEWSCASGKKEDSNIYVMTAYRVNQTSLGYIGYTFGPFYDDMVILDTVEASVVLADELLVKNEYYYADLVISVMYALQYWIYAIALASLLFAIACFVFLMCSSGHHKGLPEPQPGWGTKVPFDLLAAAAFLAACLAIQLGIETTYYSSPIPGVLLLSAAIIAAVVMALGLCMSFALRVKLGGWWKNTIIFYILRICWHLLKKLGGIFRMIGQLLLKLPVVWKTALVIVGICIYNFIALLAGINGDEGWTVILLVLEGLVLIPAVLYAALMLRKLYHSSQALASGDLSYQIDTSRLVWDFKKAAENLNSIGSGMTLAVEERTKSERMKTELITNVSHDIKTPLTSIINYSDLIAKEPCDNPNITEYADVLHRQSERLKRLIDDLVEASKASTGNLEVLLAPCELNVLLTQTAGEYAQRMEDAGLELITQMPENAVRILGDGRRMWRVFDNLMNNACKYAMPGTRVYISLQKLDNTALIAFKNTSRMPLNISADELMERFVRGDASRNTDGNGLGLSIAKSLTELQNGSLRLSVDGDFFKVELRFPTI